MTLPWRRRAGSADRGVARAADRVRAFVAAHPGAGEPALAVQHLGRGLTRLVVVAADGAVGDVVVRGGGRGAAVAELTALRVVDQAARELGSAMHLGTYEWRRMAGQQLGGGRPGRRQTQEGA